MPIEARFDDRRSILFITVSGTWPTLPEIVAERSRLILAGYIREGVVELVDARTVRRGIPNLSQMKAILNAVGALPHKRALLVSSNVQYGAGRLAELLDPNAVRVFRDEAAALEWLLAERTADRRPPASA
jgi:hypothetical protein